MLVNIVERDNLNEQHAYEIQLMHLVITGIERILGAAPILQIDQMFDNNEAIFSALSSIVKKRLFWNGTSFLNFVYVREN